MKKITNLVSLALLVNINTTFADHPAKLDNPTNQSSGTSALEEEILWLKEETYVSTATKTLEDINKSGATVSVITAEDLKNMGARNLNDALNRVPGLGINQFNIGMPAVEVRGVKTDFGEKVLFLINGHPSNTNVVNGGSTWVYENFNVDEIERVEVVRGTGSALYGADAFVATINIITKSADEIDGTILTLGQGSYDTDKFNMQLGKEFNGLKVALNANINETDGSKGEVKHDALGNSGELDSWVRRYDLGFNMEYDHFTLQGKYVDRAAGSYAGVANALNTVTEQDYKQYFVELGYSLELDNNIKVTSKLYFDHFTADNYWQFFPEFAGFPDPDGMLGRTPGKVDRTGGEVQAELALSKRNKLLVGAMYEHQSLYGVRLISNYNPLDNSPTGVYTEAPDEWLWNDSHNRDIRALYVQDIWDPRDDLRLIIGGRYDHYNDFGDTFNPRTSLTWEFKRNYNVIVTYGSAFRAPSFGELYNQNNPAVVGNPNVEPEEIETYEIGIAGNLSKRMNFRITGFHNNIRNIIAPTPSTIAANESGNVGKLKVDGLEMELSSRLQGGSKLAVNYTYQNPRNELTGKRAHDVARQKINASFNYRHSRHVNIYAGLSHRGELTRAPNDLRSNVSSYTTTDLAVNWKDATDHWEATATIYNFFDKTYFDASPDAQPASDPERSDYPKPGRNFMFEVSYKL